MGRDKFQSRALFGLDRARDRMPWLEPAALLKGEGELLPPPWAQPGLLKLDLDNLGLFFSAFGTVDQREAAGTGSGPGHPGGCHPPGGAISPLCRRG